MRRRSFPVAKLILSRCAAGFATLIAVSALVFIVTQLLPGNAATAILGARATPTRIHEIELQLHLNRSIPSQFLAWIGEMFTGHFGRSFATNGSVWEYVHVRLVNSLVLVGCAGLLATFLGVSLGVLAARRRDGIVDHVMSVVALVVIAVPEFVVAVGLIILFSTSVFHWLPPTALLPPGAYVWQQPKLMALPIMTLVVVCVPYIYRMTRGAMLEALQSDYVEMAHLKGLSSRRVVYGHALRNTVPVVVQVVGLTLLYLAGGIVVVEVVFSYPGIGQALVQAVQLRDIPVIQFLTVALAAFYVVVNIAADVIAFVMTPRRRFARSGR